MQCVKSAGQDWGHISTCYNWRRAKVERPTGGGAGDKMDVETLILCNFHFSGGKARPRQDVKPDRLALGKMES
jgi:hypothetical protein